MKKYKTINQNKVDMEIGYKKQKKALINIIKSDEKVKAYYDQMDKEVHQNRSNLNK